MLPGGLFRAGFATSITPSLGQVNGIKPGYFSVLSRPATQAAIQVPDWLAERTLPPDDSSAHLRTGCRGRERLTFISESGLYQPGYTMVARNFRSPRRDRSDRPGEGVALLRGS